MSYAIAASSTGLLQGPRSQATRRSRRRRSRAVNEPAWRHRFGQDLRGRYHVFGAVGYRFYRSNTGPPQLGDTPFATNATLPHEPADTYADGAWWLSVSYYNGLVDSGFLPLGDRGETFIRFDLSGGAVVGSPPAGPLIWSLRQIESGTIRITGAYWETGANRATEWSVGLAIAPAIPAMDTPVTTYAMPATGLAQLQADIGGVGGLTLNLRLQTRRNDGVWIYSENTDVQKIKVLAAPDAIEGLGTWPGHVPEAL